jgi:fumarate reductase flavoprotein subunit
MSAIPEKVDVVVAGAGAAGLAAAVTLAAGGATVALFEKQRALGGTSNFFRGTFAVESELQRAQFVDYGRDEAFHNIMEYSHWIANARLVRAIVDESAATITWLQEQGVEFTGKLVNMPRAPQTYHEIKGTGEAVVKALVTRAKSTGALIFPETPVVSLAKEGGRISGVVVEAEGMEVQVAAKAGVIATGGYANNKEWIKKFTGFDLGVNLLVWGNTGKMGDGIRMAWEAGAAEDGVESLEILRVGPVGPEFPLGGNDIEVVAVQPDLWVTARGERFCDEAVALYDTHSGNVNARFSSDGFTYSLFDESIVDRQIEGGIDRGLGLLYAPGYKPENFRKEMRAAVAAGSKEVFMADSLEQLAGMIDVDPAVLRATVDEYNDHCAREHDRLFAKDPKFLHPLVGPTFYAVKARTIALGTKGGIRVNEKLEVLDKKSAVIPGLYAGGFDAGGMYGDSYPIRVSSGLSSGFALNSGRIAGRNALRYLKG